MQTKLSELWKKILQFVSNKKFILAAVALTLIAVLVVIVLKGGNFATEETPTTQTTETAATTTVQTEPEDPTIYPEEIFEYQKPEKDVEYLQTDMFTTLDNNVFMDALVYTGYNIEKHRADGKMWEYVPAKSKAGLGYLSGISYGGGNSGLETDTNGKPNIARFESGNLVCATFVTYVYFNYLPNVAGIDTSALTKPDTYFSANSWYHAALDWVEKGYSEKIPFDYTVQGALGNSFIRFKPEREIPVGSLVVFCNPKTDMSSGSHVAIYAGQAGGYDWLYHVGNDNGPEFCAVQRMNFGPNARWPIAVITPPSNVAFTPTLEIELVDKAGKPIPGSEFILKHPTSGKELSLGFTDEEGKLVKTDLSYGDYTLTHILPQGYTCETAENSIQLSGVNNSYNKVFIVNTKEKF